MTHAFCETISAKHSAASMRMLQQLADAALDNNDSYHLLDKASRLLRTGPPRTNVMDIVILLVEPKEA